MENGQQKIGGEAGSVSVDTSAHEQQIAQIKEAAAAARRARKEKAGKVTSGHVVEKPE